MSMHRDVLRPDSDAAAMLLLRWSRRKMGMGKVRPEDTERMIQLLDRDGDRQVSMCPLMNLLAPCALAVPHTAGLRS